MAIGRFISAFVDDAFLGLEAHEVLLQMPRYPKKDFY
jgi:hypothetical protein